MALKPNKKITMLRTEHELSQEQLGNMVGVTRQTISSIERGIVQPSLTLKLAFCKAFNKEIKELF